MIYESYQCCCMSTFDSSLQALDSTTCSSECDGDSSEYCGSYTGYLKYNIYATNLSNF